MMEVKFNSSNLFHHGYTIQVLQHGLVLNASARVNKSMFFYHGRSNMIIDGLLPIRNVTLTAYSISHFGYSKPIIKWKMAKPDGKLIIEK